MAKAMDPAAGVALAAKILAAIKADPKITSDDIQIGFKPAHPSWPHDDIVISGSAASEDERIAVWNHVYRLTDLGTSGNLNVEESDIEDEVPVDPWTGRHADAPIIPLCAGLTVVTAISSQGDYESIKTVENITPDAVRIKYSSQRMPPWWSFPRHETPTTTTHRTVLKNDLDTAHQYNQIFVTTLRAPETGPGSTAIGTSAAVLKELKMNGESEMSLCAHGDDVEIRDNKGNVRQAPGGCVSYSEPFTLRRVGEAPTLVRVLVNGAPTDLPTVHARGEGTEFFFLDDERNPLTLAFRLGIGGVRALRPAERELCEKARRGEGLFIMTGEPPASCDLPEGGDRDSLRVISISTRCDAPLVTSGSPGSAGAGAGDGLPSAAASDGGTGTGGGGTLAGAGSGAGVGTGGGSAADKALEDALAKRGTVDVYSIYFSFNSDILREESEPTLQDIAAVLGRNPGWKLRVTGHTDGVGTDAFNLDLSRRRAVAVKTALVDRYRIDAGRLDTSGVGESQPKDTNETLEGRARNRRVELVKGD